MITISVKSTKTQNQPIIVDLICYFSIMLDLNYSFMSLNSHTVLYHKPMTEDQVPLKYKVTLHLQFPIIPSLRWQISFPLNRCDRWLILLLIQNNIASAFLRTKSDVNQPAVPACLIFWCNGSNKCRSFARTIFWQHKCDLTLWQKLLHSFFHVALELRMFLK